MFNSTFGGMTMMAADWKILGLPENPSVQEMEKAYEIQNAWKEVSLGFPKGDLDAALKDFKDAFGDRYGIEVVNAVSAGDVYYAMEILRLLPEKLLGFPSVTAQLMIYVGAASAGYFLPMLWLRHVTSQRKEKLLEAFPDALDLMVVCVEAGLGLDAAISRVSSEIRFAHKELAEEFNLVSLELRTA